jgi:hypothetical protein
MMFGLNYVRRVVAGHRAWWGAEGRAAYRDPGLWRIATAAALVQVFVLLGVMVWMGETRVVGGSPTAPPAPLLPPAPAFRPLPPSAPTVQSAEGAPIVGSYRVPGPSWHRVPAAAPGWHGSHNYGYDAIDSAGGCGLFYGGSAAPDNDPVINARPEPYPPLFACDHASGHFDVALVLDMLPSVTWDRWAWAAAGGDPRDFRAPEPWCSMTPAGRDDQYKPIPRELDCAASQQFRITIPPEAEALVLTYLYADAQDRLAAR